MQWREYKGNIPTIESCVRELQQEDQACFACLGELASPLSAKYHQQQDDIENAGARSKPGNVTRGISRLEDDILHLYVFSWTPESHALQTTILSKYSSQKDSDSPNNGSNVRLNPIERT